MSYGSGIRVSPDAGLLLCNMAPALITLDDGVSTNEARIWDRARALYRSMLSRPEDQGALEAAISQQSSNQLLATLTEEEARHREKSSTKVMESVSQQLVIVRTFGQVAEIFVASHPNVSALIWGSLRFMMEIIVSSSKILEAAISSMKTIQQRLPALLQLRTIFPKAAQLGMAIEELCVDIIKFCCTTVKVLREGAASMYLTLYEIIERN